MRRLILVGILALAFTCAISLTVPLHYSHSSPASISDRLLQINQNDAAGPFG